MGKYGELLKVIAAELRIVMSNEDGVICKMFELFVPEGLSMLALVEYEK